MTREFLALLVISLITAAAAKAQISVINPSNTYIVRIQKPPTAPPSEADIMSRTVSACLSATYDFVCPARFSDVLAMPERFYGTRISVYGYLINGKDGLLLLPFTKPEPGPYEIMHVRLRPSNDPHKPSIPPRLMPKLEKGSLATVVGIFAPAEGALKGSVGVLTDAHDIADLSNDPQYVEQWAHGTYLPDLRLKQPSSPSVVPPQFKTAPEAH